MNEKTKRNRTLSAIFVGLGPCQSKVQVFVLGQTGINAAIVAARILRPAIRINRHYRVRFPSTRRNTRRAKCSRDVTPVVAHTVVGSVICISSGTESGVSACEMIAGRISRWWHALRRKRKARGTPLPTPEQYSLRLMGSRVLLVNISTLFQQKSCACVVRALRYAFVTLAMTLFIRSSALIVLEVVFFLGGRNAAP